MVQQREAGCVMAPRREKVQRTLDLRARFGPHLVLSLESCLYLLKLPQGDTKLIPCALAA